jgi:HKD family nuclease
MTTIRCVAQPLFQNTLETIDDALATGSLESIDVAAAYITSSGLKLLMDTFHERHADDRRVVKRWITSFDYCRTEPGALEGLLAMPSSSVRIHDALFCLDNRGTPRLPFHPKMFLFRTRKLDHVVAGSGNISRSGLSRGFEAGLAVCIERLEKVSPAAEAVASLREYFKRMWKIATPLTPKLLLAYTTLFERVEHLRNPVPTEDDIAPPDVSWGALTGADLKKLRVCRHFWIEAGNVTRNRGPNLPGNQLMMKRLSRVFFGFEASALPENSKIGDVEISYQDSVGNYSLTYSDNKMDKLVLPIPGDTGPVAYDREYLKFERTAPGKFRLSLGSRSDRGAWLRRSQRIDAAFEMSGGRKWGMF